jgi:hypothetical protein
MDTLLSDAVPVEVQIAARAAQTISENREMLADQTRIAVAKAREAAASTAEAMKGMMESQIQPGQVIDPLTQSRIDAAIAAERRREVKREHQRDERSR